MIDWTRLQELHECVYNDNIYCDMENCNITCTAHPSHKVCTVDCTNKQITIDEVLNAKKEN